MALGTRSHIFGPRNNMDSMPYLTEFTLHLFNMSFRQKLYRRETGTSISFKMDGENPYKLRKFLQQVSVRVYDVLIRSCLFLIVPEMLKISGQEKLVARSCRAPPIHQKQNREERNNVYLKYVYHIYIFLINLDLQQYRISYKVSA